MSTTVGELIKYLKDIKDTKKQVEFGVWNLNTREFENVSDFEGMFIAKDVVTIATGVIDEETE